MSSFPTFPNLPELLRQAQLIKNLQSTPQLSASQNGAPVPVNNQVNSPTIEPGGFTGQSNLPANLQGQQVQAPQSQTQPQLQPQVQSQNPQHLQNNPAESAYLQALKTSPPDITQYHPSLGRKIAGGILGALSGMRDPKLGYQVGHNIAYAPFNKQEAIYQGNLANLKAASDAEQAGILKNAQSEEYLRRSEAENARAGAEKEREKLYEFQIEHPESRYKPGASSLVNITKKDGSTELGVFDPNNKKLYGVDGKELDLSQVKDATVYKPGVQPQDKKTFVPSTGQIVDTTKGTATDVPGAKIVPKTTETPDERLALWTKEEAVRQRNRLQLASANLSNSIKRTQAASNIRTNEPTTATRNRKEVATTLLPHLDHIETLLEAAEKENSVGPLAGKWQDIMTGKLGVDDPVFKELMAERDVAAASITLLHTGARGGQGYLNEFKNIIAKANDSPDNLRAALRVMKSWTEDYKKFGEVAGNANNQPQNQGDKNTFPGGITLDDINKELQRRQQ